MNIADAVVYYFDLETLGYRITATQHSYPLNTVDFDSYSSENR